MASPSIESSRPRRWLLLAVLCLSVLLLVVSNMALNVALPTLGREMHADVSSLAWVVDSYILCFAGLLLPAGHLGDRMGRKGTMQCGLLVFLAAALGAAFAAHTWELIAARALMGAGAALVMPGTLSILATVFPPAERPKAIAIWAAVAGGSVAVSILWSGLMLEELWWGSIFLGMAVVAAAALVLGWILLPTSRSPQPRPWDPLGALLSVVATCGLIYGLIQAPDDGWASTRVLVALLVGIAGAAAFVRWEQRHARPMLEVRYFARPRFALGCAAIAAAYFALFGMYFLLTQYLQLVRGYPPLEAGVCALPAGVTQFAVANVSRPLVSRYGLRAILAGGLTASAVGLLVLASCADTSSVWPMEVGLGLLGSGIGLTMPPATGSIMSSLPAASAGVGSAVNDLVRELGGALGIALLGSITLSGYRSSLKSALTGLPRRVALHAREGLQQAVMVLGGHRASAARAAFCSGMGLALLGGAVVVAGCAAWVLVKSRTADPADDSTGTPTAIPRIPRQGGLPTRPSGPSQCTSLTAQTRARTGSA